jgi:thioredoxin
MYFMIIDISPDSLEETISENKALIIDFWAPWCAPCVRVAPVLLDLSRKYPKLVIAKIDLEQYSEAASDLHIMSVPTLRGYIDGKLVRTVVGAQGNLKEEFLDVLLASEEL